MSLASADPTRTVLAPMSDLQRHWWAAERIAPDPGLVVTTCLSVRGELVPDTLDLACDLVARRHEALRTNFARVDGNPVQLVRDDPPEGMTWRRDLGGPTAEDRNRELGRILRQEREFRFDLATGALMRLGSVRLADDDWLVVLTVHHIVADGWALGLVLRQVSETYLRLARGEQVRLAPAPQFREWAAAERAYLATPRAAVDRDYWRRVIGGIRPIRIPFDFPPAARAPARKAVRHLRIPSALSAGLRAWTVSHRATRHMALLAVFLDVIGERTDRRDVAVTTIVNRRAAAGADELVGCLMNELVIAVERPADGSVVTLLRRVKSAVAGAYDHQDRPMSQVWRESTLSPGAVDILFVHDVAVGGDSTFGGLPVRRRPIDDADNCPAPLGRNMTLRLADDGEAISGELEYNAGVYSDATVDALTARFVERVREIVG
jgi:hypothetical protein